MEKVLASDWAALIVDVPKKNGALRICGDYRMMVNQALVVDQHPLPTPDELFGALTGGKQFSKLDLSMAYQQMVLDVESRQFLTINTHRGLFRYTRLPFGVSSAPAIFQQTMDAILQDLPHVICFIDDILVTGESQAEHLKNLEEVFKRLQQYGVRIKSSKCEFLKDSVEYLGHRVDAKGIHTSENKLRAIKGAPTPRNVQELRSFLGLLNYYAKFVPDLATVLHPLLCIAT